MVWFGSPERTKEQGRKMRDNKQKGKRNHFPWPSHDIPAPINSHSCSPQHFGIRTPASPPTNTSVEGAEWETWQAKSGQRQAKECGREKIFWGLFFTQDSQHSSENLILLSCSCLLTRTNLILKQHAEPTGEKTFCNGSSLPLGTASRA